jgi:DNA mismatch endonuclease (patch repair protein)
MAKIRSVNTKPEMLVRREAHRLGYRFRLHRRDLPGKPDLVFPRLHKVVFVHGCFWHQHPACREGRIPATRPEYWEPKLMGNVQRDARALEELAREGWRSLTVWECEVEDAGRLAHALSEFLAS